MPNHLLWTGCPRRAMPVVPLTLFMLSARTSCAAQLPARYGVEAGYGCGGFSMDCRVRLKIGTGGTYTSRVGSTIEECSATCDEAGSDCGGFEYDSTQSRCSFRSNTLCNRVRAATKSCYTKQMREISADSGPKGNGHNAAGKQTASTKSKVLRENYNLTECRWLHTPPAIRYPRIRNVPPKGMHACVLKLARLQEQGLLFFQLMDGQSLAAMVGGGYHGNGDDGDLDIHVASHIHGKASHHCSGVSIGEIGFKRLTPNGQLKDKPLNEQLADVRQEIYRWSLKPRGEGYHGQPYGLPCICHWEDIEVLCVGDQTTLNYMEWTYGGSWWVPPNSGGKHTGSRYITDFANPTSTHYTGYWSWLTATLSGIRLVDSNKDGQISVPEFELYFSSHPKVNQKWVADNRRSGNNCVIANAQIHYNHTLVWGDIMVRLKAECTDVQSQAACREKNWGYFQTIWQDPPYVFPCTRAGSLPNSTQHWPQALANH